MVAFDPPGGESEACAWKGAGGTAYPQALRRSRSLRRRLEGAAGEWEGIQMDWGGDGVSAAAQP